MESSSKQYIEEIDIFRAIAFLLVTAIHFYNPAKHFIDTPNLSNDMMTTLLFSGGIGVQIFLFLSGFSLTIGRCDKNQKTEAELDVKNFFINRALRIFPLWFLCVLILYWSNKLGGLDFVLLMMLQTQNLPPLTAFNLAWSIQLEFFLYLFFPVLFTFLANSKIFLPVLLFLTLRIILSYVSTEEMRAIAFQTFMGAGSYFYMGMVFSKLYQENRIKPFGNPIINTILIVVSFVFIVELLKLDLIRPNNIEYYYVYFPEIFSILLGIMLLNYINFKNKVLNSWVLVKFTSGIFSFIGKVSYSGYLLSLFVLDFYVRNSTSLTVPRGWLGFFLDFGLYACLLVLVSTITYYSVELPFLKYRKRY